MEEACCDTCEKVPSVGPMLLLISHGCDLNYCRVAQGKQQLHDP